MSYSSSSESSAGRPKSKFFTIKRSKDFQNWKTMTLAVADNLGIRKYLEEDVVVLSEDQIELLEDDVFNIDQIAEPLAYKTAKRKYVKEKEKRKKYLKAVKMMTSSVKNAALRKVQLCTTPKEKFEAICTRFGRQRGEDLGGLVEELQNFKFKKMSVDPDDYFTQMNELNEQISQIDPNQKKNTKSLALIIMSGLNKNYSEVKTNIQLGNQETDLPIIMEKVQKHWDLNYKNKEFGKKNHTFVDSSSEDEVDDGKARKKGTKDLALTIFEKGNKSEKMNQKGVKNCGHCGATGHVEADCWKKYPEKKVEYVKNRYKPSTSAPTEVTCFGCGEKGHIKPDCPK